LLLNKHNILQTPVKSGVFLFVEFGMFEPDLEDFLKKDLKDFEECEELV
jgi:hypothetical protein